MTDEGERTNIGTVVQFDANSVTLSDDACKRLDHLVPELLGKPHRIEIRGHALSDSKQTELASFDAINISFQRAFTTMQYLVAAGIEINRIRLSPAGSSEPKISNGQVDQIENARVEVYLLEEIYEPPTQTIERLVSTKAAAAKVDAMPDEALVEPAAQDASHPKKSGRH
jgi:chemotaxis protein MotB